MTAIDLESQRIIESAIMEAFPTHGFLGEESVEAGHCASIGVIFTNQYSSFLFQYLIIREA